MVDSFIRAASEKHKFSPYAAQQLTEMLNPAAGEAMGVFAGKTGNEEPTLMMLSSADELTLYLISEAFELGMVSFGRLRGGTLSETRTFPNEPGQQTRLTNLSYSNAELAEFGGGVAFDVAAWSETDVETTQSMFAPLIGFQAA
jgi:hypothetical protein